MHCTKCGRELEPGRRFCRFCGAPVPPDPDDTTEEYFAVPPAPRDDRKAMWAFVAGIVVVVCVAVALVAYFLLRGDNNETSNRTLETVVSTTSGTGTTAAGANGGTDTTDAGGGTSTSADTSAPADLSSVVAISASSTLTPQGSVDYGTGNLVDNDPATCWAEGVPGYGVGESLEFAFAGPVMVTEIHIIPGYDKVADGWDRWTSNGRVRSFTVDFSDGASETFSVTDTRDTQVLTLSAPHTVTSVRLTITDVYQAEEGPNKAEDTSVSELQLWGTG